MDFYLILIDLIWTFFKEVFSLLSNQPLFTWGHLQTLVKIKIYSLKLFHIRKLIYYFTMAFMNQLLKTRKNLFLSFSNILLIQKILSEYSVLHKLI